MMTIADAAASLTADPRPVLLLDTCVLLDVIRAGARAQSDRINECKILSNTVITAPGRVQPIVTSLVLREWLQNKEEVRQEAFQWLAETDKQILEVHAAWDRLGTPRPEQAPTYNDPGLVDALTSLGESLLRGAIVLKEHNACVMRALQRVKLKRRPSHKKEIKDSIHLEHYLELARQLRDSGYAQPTIFVSTNSSDFWQDKNTPSQAHPHLRAELMAAHLQFFGRLDFALRSLGLLPGGPPAAAGGP